VLGLLEALGEATPYELRQAIEQSVENFWPAPYMTLYREPARLARGGYVRERQEDGGRRRRFYVLTERGQDALDGWRAEPADALSAPEYRDEGMLKLFFGAEPEPIFAQRAEWHRAKLAELRAYAEEMRPEWPAGTRVALEAGITYHDLLASAYEERLAGG
jgi:DNA-binding PadR family transcriptional regulator